MQFIVITEDKIFEEEPIAVNALFNNGLATLHLRKPGANSKQLSEWLERIDPAFHPRIVLHDCFKLIDKYHLKGVHLNSRNKEVPISETPISVSCSFHSLKECQKEAKKYNYVFLSPIYNSISKEGYASNFTKEELTNAHNRGIINSSTIALGGIATSNIREVASYGFGGIATIGTIWKDYRVNKNLDALIARFTHIKEITEDL
ncbi:thiamine phosphate synthase [Bacteroides sp. 214]|uniref:thiamine phosphate synthase n=1 Tax=Bacteroides sp. 214 TaxID=2302935 RepID=UPI0013D0CDCC|nr:thiamine phosphate synthase [Bacteroides sp. 214]